MFMTLHDEDNYDEKTIIRMLNFPIDSTCVVFGGTAVQRTIRIPMGYHTTMPVV